MRSWFRRKRIASNEDISQEKAREYQQMACIMRQRLHLLSFMAGEDGVTLEILQGQIGLVEKQIMEYIKDEAARIRVYKAIGLLASLPKGMIRNDAVDGACNII